MQLRESAWPLLGLQMWTMSVVGSPLLHVLPFKGSTDMNIYNITSRLSLVRLFLFLSLNLFPAGGLSVKKLGLSKYRLHVRVGPPSTSTPAFAMGKPSGPCWACPHADPQHFWQRVPSGIGTVLYGEECRYPKMRLKTGVQLWLSQSPWTPTYHYSKSRPRALGCLCLGTYLFSPAVNVCDRDGQIFEFHVSLFQAHDKVMQMPKMCHLLDHVSIWAWEPLQDLTADIFMKVFSELNAICLLYKRHMCVIQDIY